jgi:hypothetical protein
MVPAEGAPRAVSAISSNVSVLTLSPDTFLHRESRHLYKRMQTNEGHRLKRRESESKDHMAAGSMSFSSLKSRFAQLTLSAPPSPRIDAGASWQP